MEGFRHSDAGQMNFYLNYFKRRVMAVDDNPPVGIILCSDRDQTKVEFTTAGLDNQLFVSRYLVALLNELHRGKAQTVRSFFYAQQR